ncbi:MAG: hypothetical protein QOK47_602, partial [Actinomycetota bacterium]|nr:hypothetical protein [Actinomycetota bacterium]
VDLEALLDSARIAQELIAAELPSKVLKAGPRNQTGGRVTRAS